MTNVMLIATNSKAQHPVDVGGVTCLSCHSSLDEGTTPWRCLDCHRENYYGGRATSARRR